MPNPITPLTKRTCKTVLSSLRDMKIKDFDLVVEGGNLRVVIRSDASGLDNDMADRIDAA